MPRLSGIQQFALFEVCAQAQQTYAFFFWIEDGQNVPMHGHSMDESDARLAVLHNACLESTLLSLRRLDDFFSPSGVKRADDLHVSSFGIESGSSSLGDERRVQINKCLVHLTDRQFSQGVAAFGIWQLALQFTDLLLVFFSEIQSKYDLDEAQSHIVQTASRRLRHWRSLLEQRFAQ